MRFESPLLLLILLAVPLWWWLNQLWSRPRFLQFSGVYHLKASTYHSWWTHPYILPILRCLGLTLLVLAMARPQTGRSYTEVVTEGVDIVVAVDTSESMRALDLKIEEQHVTRLAVVKQVLADFIKKRSNDRLGMVVFGEEAFTQAPLTHDHDLLVQFLDQSFIGMAGNATAIGSAIAVGSKRLKDLKAKSKVLILLTDGQNTAGNIDPQQAADAAKELGIKVYTIGVGTRGKAPFQVDGFFGKQIVYQEVSIDENLLRGIASATGGQYFRATDTESLKAIYETIDQLETTEAKIKEYHQYSEKFHWFLIPAIVILLLEFILAATRLRSLP